MLSHTYLLLIFFLPLQEYTVVNHPHGAYVYRLGRLAHQGDRLTAEDSVRFTAASDILRLIGPRGVLLLSAKQSKVRQQGTSTSFLSVVANAIQPQRTDGITAGRAGILNSLTEVESFIGQFADSSRPLLIIDSLLLPLGSELSANRETQFFYLSYQEGKEIIDKKIPFSIHRKQLYLQLDQRLVQIDGRTVGWTASRKAILFFYDDKKEISTLVGSFYLRHLSSDSLQSELCVIAKAMGSNTAQPNEALLKTVHQYVQDAYGWADAKALQSLLLFLHCAQ